MKYIQLFIIHCFCNILLECMNSYASGVLVVRADTHYWRTLWGTVFRIWNDENILLRIDDNEYKATAASIAQMLQKDPVAKNQPKGCKTENCDPATNKAGLA